MNGWSIGPVIIEARKNKGLFHKTTRYEGSLKNNPNLYGFSTNKMFLREYRPGDIVKTRYRMKTVPTGRGREDEYLEFEIIE